MPGGWPGFLERSVKSRRAPSAVSTRRRSGDAAGTAVADLKPRRAEPGVAMPVLPDANEQGPAGAELARGEGAQTIRAAVVSDQPPGLSHWPGVTRTCSTAVPRVAARAASARCPTLSATAAPLARLSHGYTQGYQS